MNVLVLDDEIEIADLVELYLKNENYNVFKFYDADEALKCIKKEKIDLAILDVMVGNIDGFEICKFIRSNNFNYPVIMLTAKIQNEDKIEGLTVGADDYITKPFNPLELMARVKAQLRRYTKYNNESDKDEIIINGLVINNRKHECTLYDEEIILTPTEFSILYYLCSHAGCVVESEELFENVWGEKYLDCNNTVMVHIRRIREKLHDDAKNPKYIKTLWGVGYTIENEG